MKVLVGIRPLVYTVLIIDGNEYSMSAAPVVQNESVLLSVRLRNTSHICSTCGVTIDPRGHAIDSFVEYGGNELVGDNKQFQSFIVQGNENMNVNGAGQLEINARIDPGMFVEIRLSLTPAANNNNPSVGIGPEIANLPFFYSMKAPGGGYATTTVVAPVAP
jgi:hypothetical protein